MVCIYITGSVGGDIWVGSAGWGKNKGQCSM